MEKGQKVKTKVRFTSLDVAAMVENMQALIGMRATNIYDLNPSTYLIKLAKSQDKSYLLIQNGVRFHTTSQRPDKKSLPSGFTMKFRKYLRSKRLQAIRQVGVQRVVVFTFGSQSFVNHLIIELYAQGNIILTDNDYRILQCIRSHEFNDKVKTAVGQIYPFEYAANIYLENLIVNEQKISEILEKDEKLEETANQKGQQGGKGKGKKNNKKGPVKLKDVMFKLLPCLFPLVIDHILLTNNKNPDEKVSKQNKEFVLQSGEICLNFLKNYLQSKHKGYLFYKEGTQMKDDKKQVEYFQFSSYKNKKYQSQACRQYGTFDEAVCEYFINYKKNQHQEEQNIEGIAWKKYDQIKKDQDQRVRKLQEEQQTYKLKAEYIQKNIADVDAIIKIIKTMQDNGYSWDDISRMISQSKKNGDPLANMIHQLNILKRQVTILLGDPVSEQQMFKLLPVEINIDYNAYTNATMYYENKKKNYQKEQRTKQASQQVLKQAEKQALKKIEKKKNQVFSKNLPQRKVFWFEKFSWFISSEGYLVISGRDSHQNQLLVKRYMKTGDIYMHSDYGGAASTVIKTLRKDIAVPVNTLQEAAIFTVCRSKAWQTKIISGAWWVYPEQVSKSAPTGEFLPTGSFMIRGKRNFIYPNRMQMGMTLLFKVDNESAQRHLNDRRIHEEEIKKQQEENKKVIGSTEESEQDQFAIVSIDTQTRKQKLQQKNKAKQNMKKQPSKVQEPKEKAKEAQIDSDEENEEESEEEQKIQLTKKPSQTNKNTKASNKKEEANQQVNQQKHKQRNKKKLKKLQKYLEEQDEDQRQIIMKMLGAQQMKHMKAPEQIESNPKKQGQNKKKKDKKDVKKGINKYIDFESDDQQKKQKLNPDKVLFLKEKNKNQEEQKKLMENSSSSQDEVQNNKQKGQVTENNQQKNNQIEQPQVQNEDQDQDNMEQNQQQPPEQNKQPEEQIDEKILDSQLGQLYKLVGNPHPEDKSQFFVPMCAPYNAIKENKFKIKLVPGGLKKGKAARNILQYFQTGDLSEKQKIMLKSLPEQQLINAVIGNVKLAGAGLLKMEMKEKQQKKMKRKEQDKKKQMKDIE